MIKKYSTQPCTKEESALEYDEYYGVHRNIRLRREAARARKNLFMAVAAILLLSAVITAVLESGAPKEEEPFVPVPAGSNESILAPLPFANSTFADLSSVQHSYDPVKQQGGGVLQEMDYAHIARKSAGQVQTTYFADAAFLGDSITQGYTEYDINMNGALICGYIGASPNQIVQRTTMKHSERGPEVPLDVLAAAQPAKLYVLMGANTLGVLGNDKNFLAYYGEMVKQLRELLPNTIIYVQALTPVQSFVTERVPGMDNARFRTLNLELANIAYTNGCQFLDLYAAFADENGELSAEYAQPDGIHITVSGYEHWVDYLCRHTVYSADNPWLPGSAFAEKTVMERTAAQ